MDDTELAESAEQKARTELVESLEQNAPAGLAISMNQDQIIQYWTSGKGTYVEHDNRRNRIEHAVKTGALTAHVHVLRPDDSGFSDVPVKDWRRIRDGYFDGGDVYYEIHRDAFRGWLEREGEWPLPDDCLLSFWWRNQEPLEPDQPKQTDDPRIIPIIELAKKDDWFYVIRDTARAFETEHGFTPSHSQLWARLVSTPPEEYGITYDSDSDRLSFPGAKPMDRENFNKRFKRYFSSGNPQ